MKVKRQGVFECDGRTYFEELFNYQARKTRETEGRGALCFRVLQSDKSGDTWKHSVEFEERFEAPSPVRKLIGETTFVVEELIWKPGEKKAEVTYKPKTLATKTSISGVIIAEDIGNGKCRVTMDTDLQINVFALGRIMEKITAEKFRRDFRKDMDYFNEVRAPCLKNGD